MGNIGACIDQITNGFQTNVIYFSRILQKYQQKFGKDHILTQKTSLIIEKTLKTIMEFLNSHPEYVVFVLGVPIRDSQQTKQQPKNTEQEIIQEQANENEQVFQESGTVTHDDLNKKKKYTKITLDQQPNTIKKEMFVQKEKIDPNDEIYYNSSGFLFTYRPDNRFQSIVQGMLNRNSLIADTNDLKYLYNIKDSKTNQQQNQDQSRKSPKLKKRPAKSISKEFLRSYSRVENKLYNIQAQQSVQVFAEQLENINLPLETEDFDNNLKFNFTFTDKELILAMRRTEIQLQYQIYHHPFSQMLAKENSEFQPIESDWQRQIAEAHDLEDLQTIVDQKFLQQYREYLDQLQLKIKRLNKLIKEKLGLVGFVSPVVFFCIFALVLMKEFVSWRYVDLKSVASIVLGFIIFINFFTEDIFYLLSSSQTTYPEAFKSSIDFITVILLSILILHLRECIQDIKIVIKIAQCSQNLSEFIMKVYLSFWERQLVEFQKDDIYLAHKSQKIGEEEQLEEEYVAMVNLEKSNESKEESSILIKQNGKSFIKCNNYSYFKKFLEMDGTFILIVSTLIINYLWRKIDINLEKDFQEVYKEHFETLFFFFILSLFFMSIPLNYNEVYYTKSLKFRVDRVLMFYYGLIFTFISISHFLKVTKIMLGFSQFLYTITQLLLLSHILFLCMNKKLYKKKLKGKRYVLSVEFDLYKTLQFPVLLLGLLSADLNLKFTLLFMIVPILLIFRQCLKNMIFNNQNQTMLAIFYFTLLVREIELAFHLSKQDIEYKIFQANYEQFQYFNIFAMIFYNKQNIFGKNLILFLDGAAIWSVFGAFLIYINKFYFKKNLKVISLMKNFGIELNKDFTIVFSGILLKFFLLCIYFERNFINANEESYVLILQKIIGITTFFIIICLPVLSNHLITLVINFLFR